MLMTSQKSVKLIDDAGQGAVIVFLRSTATVSRSVDVLQNEFRVLSFSIDSGMPVSELVDMLAQALASLKVEQAAIIADRAATGAAVALAVAHPGLVQSLALLSPEGAVADASGLKAPALAIFGTADTVRATDAPRNFCRSIPNCRLMYVYDAGGSVDDERPEAVAAALQEFVIRREGFLVTAKQGKLYP
jgi:pimeloyl-ACP methyl ester carboxylesterase